jgi:hypothetical protein
MAVRLLAALTGLGVVLAGCVAPEEPAPPQASRLATPAASQPSTAKFEEAPVPNRKVGGPTGDSVIRVQH